MDFLLVSGKENRPLMKRNFSSLTVYLNTSQLPSPSERDPGGEVTLPERDSSKAAVEGVRRGYDSALAFTSTRFQEAIHPSRAASRV